MRRTKGNPKRTKRTPTTPKASGVGGRTKQARPPAENVHARAELQAIAQAAKLDWPVTPEGRTEAVAQCMKDVKSGKPRVRIAAVKALAMLNQQNQTREFHADKMKAAGTAADLVMKLYSQEFPMDGV